MSFSSEVKEELARLVPRRRCCRKSELLGLFKACGTLRLGREGASVAIEAENSLVARKVFLYFKQLYGLQAQILVRRRQRLRRTNVYMVRVTSSDVVSSVLKDLGLSDPFGETPREGAKRAYSDPDYPKCCSRAFLRGFFLGSGFVGSPGKGHHLEMPVNDGLSAEQMIALLNHFDISAKVSARRTGPLVYIKHGADIADFLNVVGAHSALMTYENVRAYKTMKSRVNRLVNMETANLTKVARAASRQTDDITFIQQTLGLSSLPEALMDTARLRLEHPEATLEELGQLASPPVGKSGVNHRMRKLSAIASDLRKSDERAAVQNA